MVYIVYKARYKTLKGTWREYVGHTRNLCVRRHWHERKPPTWMKPNPVRN